MKNFFLIFLLLIFAACSMSVDKTGVEESQINGNGLEVSFSIDDSSVEIGRLILILNIKNTGEDPITLTPEQIILATIEKDSQGNSIITQDSIQAFYQRLFQRDEISLFQNQEIKNIRVPLFIEESYLNDVTNEDLNLFIEINYPYSTQFSNNIYISKSSSNILKVNDKISQAAPLKLDKFKIEEIGLNDYELNLRLYPSNSLGSQFTIFGEDAELLFGGQNLNCQFSDQIFSNKKISFSLSSKVKEQFIICPLIIVNDDYISQLSGIINYDVSMRLENKVSLK